MTEHAAPVTVFLSLLWLASLPALPRAQGATEPTLPAPSAPVRLNRAFFEGELVATDSLFKEQLVPEWVYRAPSGPAPEPGAIADFRDRDQCATFEEWGELTLCLTITPDLASVELTPTRVRLEIPGCDAVPLERALRTEQGIFLRFSSEHCREAPLHELSLTRQVS